MTRITREVLIDALKSEVSFFQFYSPEASDVIDGLSMYLGHDLAELVRLGREVLAMEARLTDERPSRINPKEGE